MEGDRIPIKLRECGWNATSNGFVSQTVCRVESKCDHMGAMVKKGL
jgi:hypothetical protein